MEKSHAQYNPANSACMKSPQHQREARARRRQSATCMLWMACFMLLECIPLSYAYNCVSCPAGTPSAPTCVVLESFQWHSCALIPPLDSRLLLLEYCMCVVPRGQVSRLCEQRCVRQLPRRHRQPCWEHCTFLLHHLPCWQIFVSRCMLAVSAADCTTLLRLRSVRVH